MSAMAEQCDHRQIKLHLADAKVALNPKEYWRDCSRTPLYGDCGKAGGNECRYDDFENSYLPAGNGADHGEHHEAKHVVDDGCRHNNAAGAMLEQSTRREDLSRYSYTSCHQSSGHEDGFGMRLAPETHYTPTKTKRDDNA